MHNLTLDEIASLQCFLIEDTRFVCSDLHTDSVFVEEVDQHDNPLTEFIGARPNDL